MSHLVLTCFVGDRIQDLKLALYSDASFADDLATSKSCTGTVLSIVGPNTYVPLTWLCKKQTAVSHPPGHHRQQAARPGLSTGAALSSPKLCA